MDPSRMHRQTLSSVQEDTVILNKYCSLHSKSHKRRLDGNVNSNTCSPKGRSGFPHKCEEITYNSPNDSYYDQPDIIIKKELIEELEGTTESCQMEQIHCSTDIKEEIVDMDMRSEVQSTEEESETLSDSSRFENELSKMCSSDRTETNESLEQRYISQNTMKAVAPTKFDSLAPNKLVKKSSSTSSKSYYINPQNANNTTAGPSRFDSEVLNNETESVKWLIEPEIKENNENDSFHKQQNSIVGKEIAIFPPREQTNPSLTDLTNEPNNLNKRCGSLLEEAEIKKEKIDDEAYVNEDYQTQNQMFIENEVHEEVRIRTEYCNDTTENFSSHTRSDREIMKEWRSIEQENVSGRPWNAEERFWCSNRICLLCDIYIGGTIKEHITEYHTDGIFFSCPYCDCAKKISSSALHNELRKHMKETLLSCNLCVEQCRYWMDLNAHMYQKHNVKMNTTCSICGFKADSHRAHLDLIDHIFGSHNGRTLVHNCEHCTFATLNISRLQFHMEMRHSVKGFPASSQPPVHDKKTLKMRKYKKMLKKCPLCGFTETCKNKFRTHMLNEHKE